MAEERGDGWTSVPLVRATFAEPPNVWDEEDFSPVPIEEQPHKEASNAIRANEQILPGIRFNCNRQGGTNVRSVRRTMTSFVCKILYGKGLRGSAR